MRILAYCVKLPWVSPVLRLYTLHAGETDLLIERLWSTISLNPEFFRSSIRANLVPVAASAYEDENVHLIYM